jgi:hypothetical protein
MVVSLRYILASRTSLTAHLELFVALANNSEKLPYMARSVHFCDNGSSVLVSYLESGFMYVVVPSPPFITFMHN